MTWWDMVESEARTAIGRGVRGARSDRGWSQRTLEKYSGVDQSTISRLENGRVIGLRFATFVKLLDALDVRAVSISVRRSPGHGTSTSDREAASAAGRSDLETPWPTLGARPPEDARPPGEDGRPPGENGRPRVDVAAPISSIEALLRLGDAANGINAEDSS